MEKNQGKTITEVVALFSANLQEKRALNKIAAAYYIGAKSATETFAEVLTIYAQETGETKFSLNELQQICDALSAAVEIEAKKLPEGETLLEEINQMNREEGE